MNTRPHALIGAILLLIMVACIPIGVGAAPGVTQPSSAMVYQDQPGDPTQVPTTDPTTASVLEPTTELVLQPTAEPTPTVAPPTAEPTPTVAPPTIGVPTVAPTSEPTGVPPTDEPDEELSSFFITKLFCASIDETAEDPCVGRVEAAEGTTVSFEVTHLDEGWSDIVPVEIEEFDGYTVGAVLYYDAPLGTYQITEIVPAGYDAFAVPLHDGQSAEGASVTIELGPVEEEEEAFFVNVPFGQKPPATTPPGTTTPATGVPDVRPPDVTPDAEVSVETTPETATVAALPDTGAGATTGSATWLAGVELGLVTLLLAGAIGLRRRSGREPAG